MPSYKLTYFNFRGRAEAIRLLFALAEVDYEDCRISKEEWLELKASGRCPFGQVPILEEDGKVAAQSRALARYLAQKFGFYGKDSWEGLQIDMLLCHIDDFVIKSRDVFMGNPKEEETREKIKKFQEEDFPKFAESITKHLQSNDGTHFVGNEWTVADVAMYDLEYLLVLRDPGVFDKFPKLQAHYEAVGNIPQIKKYVEARPQTAI